jgi:hypothetical protein
MYQFFCGAFYDSQTYYNYDLHVFFSFLFLFPFPFQGWAKLSKNKMKETFLEISFLKLSNNERVLSMECMEQSWPKEVLQNPSHKGALCRGGAIPKILGLGQGNS